MNTFNSFGIIGKIGDRVYQRVRTGLGNVEGDPTHSLQNRAYVPHNTSHTPAQQTRRALFAGGVAAWHSLSADERKSWRANAAPFDMSGFNLWMSNWLREN